MAKDLISDDLKPYLGIALALVVAVLFITLISDSFAKFEGRIWDTAVCDFGSSSSCKDIFYKYTKNVADYPTAEHIGKRLCFAKKNPDLAICSKLAAVHERLEHWPEAIAAHGAVCDAGAQDECMAQLVLMGRFSAQADTLVRAEALCQKELPTACYWTGIVGWKMNDKESQRWGFHQGCFKFSVAESCLSLGEYYVRQKQNQRAINAFIEGCSLSLDKSCARSKALQDSMAMSSELVAHINEHRVVRDQLKQTLTALSKGAVSKADALKKLDGFRGRLLTIESDYRTMPEKFVTEIALRNLFAKELTLELSTIDDVQGVLRRNGRPADLARFAQKPSLAQRDAETAFGRLPAGH